MLAYIYVIIMIYIYIFIQSNFDKRDKNKHRQTSRLDIISFLTFSGIRPAYTFASVKCCKRDESRLSLLAKRACACRQ
jgi:hypothetical protein